MPDLTVHIKPDCVIETYWVYDRSKSNTFGNNHFNYIIS